MMQYVLYTVFGIVFICLALTGIVALCVAIWILFGDLIEHHAKIRKMRKKWKE